MERKQKRQVSDLPLLYIAQPDFKAVKHQMQQTFVIKKDVKEDENHIKQQVDETLATTEKETSIEPQELATIHKGAVQEKEQAEEAQGSTMESPEEMIRRNAVEYQETEAVHQAVVEKQEQAEEALESQEETIRGSAVEYQETEAVHQAVVEEQEQAEEAQESTMESPEETIRGSAAEYQETEAVHQAVIADEETIIESEEDAEVIPENAVELEEYREEQEITNEPEMNHEEPVKNRWQAISFREMNNKEKIDYLLNRPHYIPEVRCFIRTKQSSYIGYIKADEAGTIKIKSPAKVTDIVVDIKDILSIQMIGT